MSSNIKHPEISKGINIKNIIIASILAVAGIITLILSWFGIAAILLITAIVAFAVWAKTDTYKPSGSPVKKVSFYFDKEYLSAIQEIIGEKIKDDPKIIKFVKMGSARIDLICSEDKEFAAVQLFEFVPHTYEEVTKLTSYKGAEAKKLLDYIENCKK
jgi:hypothetical protein